MKYKHFFPEYHHPHHRHDPPGSEDADVNNDGKVDKNDKYIMAKRRLYKQYQAVQKSKKATDFSTPKLENNMIKLSGLVNLQTLKEEEKWIQHAIKKPGALHKQLGVPQDEPIPAGKLAAAAEKGGKLGKRARLAQTLKKLKEMEMTPDQEKKIDEMLAQMEELTAGQKKLDVDGDGKIEGDDLTKLRAGKKTDEAMGEDHEVSMANSTLDSIIKHATELKGKIGMEEKDIPAWIQDHIAVAENNLDQANTSYHEYGQETDKPVDQDMAAMKEGLNEAAPEGWEKTIKAMKKHKEIDNPWALANWMKKKGYKPQNEAVDVEDGVVDEIGTMKKIAYVAKAARDIVRQKKRQKEAQKQADAPPRIGVKGKETPASARDRTAAAKVATAAGKKIDKRVKGIDTARGFKGPDTAKGAKVKNPETGKEILATTAAKDPSHPAHSAAKSALGKK